MALAQTTIRLLEDLQGLGFDDRAFQRLHHYYVRPWKPADTIQKHLDYLRKNSIRNVRGSNARVQERLRFVLEARNGDAQASFFDLAVKATEVIPFLESDYVKGATPSVLGDNS